MNDVLKIQSILGVVANDSSLRASRDGIEFEGVLPAPTWTEEVVLRDGTVTDTVNSMKKVIRKYAWQTLKLAPMLKGRTMYESCQNIWNHLFLHTKYKEDDKGKEQLRTPALSWAIRRSRGIDCDDFTLFAGCLMHNLNIPFYIRIARYSGKDYFQHVYPVIPLEYKRYITLDAVLDEYDAEKPPIETKDFLVMNTSNLNGIDISVLGAIEDEDLNEVSGILSGEDFREVSELEGLGTIATREHELQSIKNHLQRTRGIIARRPQFIKNVEHPKSFLGMVDYALKYWDTDKRDDALGILAGEEERVNDLEGLRGMDEDHEEVELFYGLNGLGSYDVLGKVKKQRKFFAKVKQAVKKAGAGIKKIAKALIKFNPLTASIRGAVLLALKVNLLKVSSKFKWGYLTEAEAQAKGFDLDEWKKLKKQLTAAENMYVKVLQGKASAFKKAMLGGRGGKLSGVNALGFVATAATAGAAATAVPFITKIIALLKKVNFKKLIEKVSSLKLKGKTKAEENDNPTAEGESALPEGGETSEGDPNVDTSEDAPAETTEPETTNGSETDPNAITNEGAGGEVEKVAENKENVPATTTRSTPAPAAEASEGTFIDKAMNWVKENKPASIVIALGAAGLLYYAFGRSKPKAGLSGARGGKKKKGKAKTNPPKTISGTPRKRRKRSPKKKINIPKVKL